MPVYEETDKNKITKDGRRFYYRCYYIDKYGKTKQKQSRMYLKKRECMQAERDFLNTIQYEDILDYDISFESVYNEWWNFKKKTLKSTTAYGIKGVLDKHIFIFFKEYKLHSIKINIINKWIDAIEKNNNTIKSKNRVIGYAKMLFDYAADNYNFDRKISSKIQKFKVEEISGLKESKWNFLTYDEFKQFINVVDNKYYYLIFSFLYYTGLRIGEASALNWTDIDFENKTLSINKTLSNKIGNGSYKILAPKTENSNRIIDLDDNLIELLKKHYKEESKIYKFTKNMFIFGNMNHLSTTTLRRYLNKYLKLSGIKSKRINYKEGESIITIHGFRHSHASLLINLGLDFKDVAERLGDTVEMVQNTYYHMFPTRKSKTVNAINNYNSTHNLPRILPR